MKKYIRFGGIPKNGKSINFIKMSFQEKASFSWALENLGEDAAYSEYVTEKALENGTSVFKIGKDGMPVLENLRQVNSLALRIGKPAYIVSGEEVGTGNDGEPLVQNIKVGKERRFTEDELKEYILSFLSCNFMLVIPPKKQILENQYKIYEFYEEKQVNLKTGEIKDCLCGMAEPGFRKIPGHTYFVFCGWEFRCPVDGFDADLYKID